MTCDRYGNGIENRFWKGAEAKMTKNRSSLYNSLLLQFCAVMEIFAWWVAPPYMKVVWSCAGKRDGAQSAMTHGMTERLQLSVTNLVSSHKTVCKAIIHMCQQLDWG